jgi:hypothetical protein
MKPAATKPQPKREEHYRIDGVEVTLEELAREINRCGGLAPEQAPLATLVGKSQELKRRLEARASAK